MSNSIIAENKLQGTREWELKSPAIHREIEGYASLSSVAQGREIHFFVNTPSDQFSFKIYRMGWYKGLGAREVFASENYKGLVQETPLPDTDGMVECHWKAPIAFSIPKDWTTGVYVVKLCEDEKGKESYIIFVVKEENSKADICFQLPVTTYQAYNYWGGKSLYPEGSGSVEKWGFGRGKHANRLSFNRPYYRGTNLAAAKGMGAGEFFTNVQPSASHGYPVGPAAWDYNMVRWLEKNGYDINYITSLDTHSHSELLNASKIFLSQGHDEYWSMSMRKHVENARDKGVNLTFFSSNTMFWQIRLEKSKNIPCDEPRTLVCYKEIGSDPVKGELATVNYRDIEELKSEASILGVQYAADPVLGDIKFQDTDHWIFKGSSLRPNDTLKGLLGYELDAVSEDSPSNVKILATSPYRKHCEHIICAAIRFLTKKVPSKQLFYIKQGTIGITQPSAWIVFYGGLLLTALALWPFVGIWSVAIPILGILGLLVLKALSKYKSPIKHAHMTLYEAESGAKVFATGSMQWSWGLDNYNAPELRKNYYSENAAIITHNVLRTFGAKIGKEV